MVRQTIQIFARLKPNRKNTSVYSVDNEDPTGNSLEFVVPKDLADGFINNKREHFKFRFQRVFDQTVDQEEIFETIAKPVADSVLAGYNGTIFAYGQTGSGKTYTITGGAERYNDRGIIPRTLSHLYRHFSQDSSMVYTTHISYLEIYNEVGYDLLDPHHEASNLEDLPKVMFMEDSEQNVHLRNLSLQQSANEEEALNLLFLGDTNRMIAETPMNQASTRSHCIFTVHLCGREPGSATVRRSKLHLVDLAGSERVGKARVGGHHLTEAKYINLSLHYLEQVIIALSEKNRSHIPYRNSMMTSVLRDSLGGNCMTTMISTISVDRRNLEEAMSTCRFAQRVALIKNEALLNEELDPALLIARMKREIQSLKEELAMVTGQQREDQLTQDEIQKLEEQVESFLDDPDPEVTLACGADLQKIRHSFSLMKAIITQHRLQRGNGTGDGQIAPSSEAQANPSSAGPTRLQEMLTQRDNEISILVRMLKKEKKRAQVALAQLASIGKSHRLDSENALCSLAGEERFDTKPAQPKIRGPQLSMGKEEAFETFRRDHKDRLTIEDNKAVLRRRYTEAKALGEQINRTRHNINELKKQLEMRRMQRAAQGVLEDNAVEDDKNPAEEKILKEIEREKQNYKSTFGNLKALRTEMEHLQLLLEKAKAKLQKDFQEWWHQETSPPQVLDSETSTRCQTGRPGPNSKPSSPCNLGSGSFVPKGQSAWTPSGQPRASSQQMGDRQENIFTPASELRDLSSTELSSSSIPLTGDQQTDNDILAFIRARQNLLQTTGLPQQ